MSIKAMSTTEPKETVFLGNKELQTELKQSVEALARKDFGWEKDGT